MAMTELTQMILTLDSESETALKRADASAQEVMRAADMDAERVLQEEQQRFKKQKTGDEAALAEQLEVERRKAMESLQLRMEAFERSLDFDLLIKKLLAAAKERVCR